LNGRFFLKQADTDGGACSVRLSTASRAGGVGVKSIIENKAAPKMKRPRPDVVEPPLPGRGRDQVVALPRVNAVFANDVR
jgi:hypothetical protein